MSRAAGLALSLAAAALLLAAAAWPVAASSSLLYLTAVDWQRSDRSTRTALASDFMRIYCGDIRMSPDRLVDCLDERPEPGAMFPQAMACAIRILQDTRALQPAQN